MTIETARVMEDTAREVLETMFFTPAEVAPASPPGAPPTPVGVSFHGDLSGRFTVWVPERCARIMAANFAGEDPSEVSAESAGQIIGELANMICGATLSRVAPESRFDLGGPCVAPPGPAPAMWLDTGDGVIALGLEIDA